MPVKLLSNFHTHIFTLTSTGDTQRLKLFYRWKINYLDKKNINIQSSIFFTAIFSFANAEGHFQRKITDLFFWLPITEILIKLVIIHVLRKDGYCFIIGIALTWDCASGTVYENSACESLNFKSELIKSPGLCLKSWKPGVNEFDYMCTLITSNQRTTNLKWVHNAMSFYQRKEFLAKI